MVREKININININKIIYSNLSPQLKGSVEGRGLEDFLSNDDLRTTRIIKSRCQFNTIEVNGPVTVTKSLNGINLDQIFEDIILKPNSTEPIEINSSKSFHTVKVPKVIVESAEINETPFTNFVSKTRPQELNMKKLKGYIVTNFLDITGTYDGIDIPDFFENCVYINNTNSNTHLNITAIFGEDLVASDFQVLKVFNNRLVSDVITLKNASNYFDKFTFRKLRVENLDCECDVEGVGLLNGVDIRTVKARSFKPPPQPHHLYVDHLILRKGLNVSRINSIPTENITDFLNSVQDFPLLLKTGKLSIDKIVVKGGVKVNTINGKEFQPDDFIWLNRENIITSPLEFRDSLHFEQNMYINGHLNDESLRFPEFLEQIAFKSENYIHLKGSKEFLYSLMCEDNIFVEEINGIPFSEIAMKSTPIEFAKDLVIKGNFHVNVLNVRQTLNGYDIVDLPRLCRYDSFLNSWVFGGPFLFKGHVYVHDLVLRRSVNDVDDIDELLDSLTYTNQISVLKGRTIFKNEVSINSGGFIKHLNGMDLMDVLNNMVFIAGTGQVKVSGPVVFVRPVSAKYITVKDALEAENIKNCNIHDWVEHNVNINEDVKLNGEY